MSSSTRIRFLKLIFDNLKYQLLLEFIIKIIAQWIGFTMYFIAVKYVKTKPKNHISISHPFPRPIIITTDTGLVS